MWEFTIADNSDRHSAVILMNKEVVARVLAIMGNVMSNFMDASGPLPFNRGTLSDLVSFEFASYTLGSCLEFYFLLPSVGAWERHGLPAPSS